MDTKVHECGILRVPSGAFLHFVVHTPRPLPTLNSTRNLRDPAPAE